MLLKEVLLKGPGSYATGAWHTPWLLCRVDPEIDPECHSAAVQPQSPRVPMQKSCKLVHIAHCGYTAPSYLCHAQMAEHLWLKGAPMGSPEQGTQGCRLKTMRTYLPGSLCSHYIPAMFLGFPTVRNERTIKVWAHVPGAAIAA